MVVESIVRHQMKLADYSFCATMLIRSLSSRIPQKLLCTLFSNIPLIDANSTALTLSTNNVLDVKNTTLQIFLL